MMWWNVWWVWIVAGFLIGALEIVAPGYIFLGFAIGAVVTGILVGVGIAPPGPALLVLIFAVCSLVAWLVLRRTMGVRKNQVKVWDRDINDS
jgi:membrane protein implicated in regulation of membrane protease activity